MGGLFSRPYKRGIRKAPPAAVNPTASNIVALVAATTPLAIWPTTPTRTAVIRKIHMSSTDTQPTSVQIGTGIANFVAALPDIQMVTGSPATDLELDEDHIPNVEFSVPITAQVTSHTAGSVKIVLEVEEYQGSTNHA